jgi:integrase
VADIRAQTFNRKAEQSGDFVEFLGLAGLGQAEASALTRAHVDFAAGQIIVYRKKTDTGFAVPIFPQLRSLFEKVCTGKGHNERLFTIYEARKALHNACKRLGFPRFTPCSLRRMFITAESRKASMLKSSRSGKGVAMAASSFCRHIVM